VGWSGYHLSEFEFYHLQLRILEEMKFDNWDFEYEEASVIQIDQYLDSEKWFTYTYDFGDHWSHRVEVEAVIKDYPDNYPKVLKAKGDCPMEDCGGIWGYYEVIEILQEPSHPRYKEVKDWLETIFYCKYDIQEVNELLKRDYFVIVGKKDTRLQREIQESMFHGEKGLIACKNVRRQSKQKKQENVDVSYSGEELYLPSHINGTFNEEYVRNYINDFVKENYNGIFNDDINSNNHNVYHEFKNATLEDIYLCYNKKELIEIAKIHHFPRVSAYNKKELAKALSEYVLQKDVMERYFIIMEDVEIDAFLSIDRKQSDISYEDEYFDYLQEGGYIGYCNMNYVPKEVINAYKLIDNKIFHRKRQQMSTLWEYCEAARVLYGAVNLDIIIKLYNKNRKDKITDEQIYNAYGCFPLNRTYFKIKDFLLISNELLVEDLYIKLINQQRDTKYYLPSEEEVKHYARFGFSPINESINNIIDFLQDNFDLSDWKACDIIVDVQRAIRSGCNLQGVIDILEGKGIVFLNELQLTNFMPYFNDMWNNTRIISNRGFTPNELANIKKRQFQQVKNVLNHNSFKNETKSNVINFEQAKKNKLYANDTCFCGSGLKYKHCCGKNK
jgi:hypothetical protein